jgi:hypothetical protein
MSNEFGFAFMLHTGEDACAPIFAEVLLMKRRAKVLLGLGLLAAAPASFAQYSLDLTGVGNGTVADGVYVSPYVGIVQGNGVNFSGYMICDDFLTESYLNTPWNATTTAASALDGSEKFGTSVVFGGTTYTAQQAYNAAGWLANGLLANLSNTTKQINYSFAIWDLFDGQTTNPSGGAATLEQEALSAAAAGYVASNVSVYTPDGYTQGGNTPNPQSVSQEFLVVHPAPEIDASVATSALTLLLGGVLVLSARRKLQA